MMTVIEIAREAGIEWDLIDEDEGQVWYITKAGLERFAELVRADERAQRKPLTDKELEEIVKRGAENKPFHHWFARAIEAAHGIKGDA